MATFLKSSAGKFLMLGGKPLKLPPKPLAVFNAVDGGSVTVKLSNGTRDTFYIDPITPSTLRYDDSEGFTFGCESGTPLCVYYYWDLLEEDYAVYYHQTTHNWIGSDHGDEFDFPARLVVYESPYDDAMVGYDYSELYFRDRNIQPIAIFDFVPGSSLNDYLSCYWQQRLDNPPLEWEEKPA